MSPNPKKSALPHLVQIAQARLLAAARERKDFRFLQLDHLNPEDTQDHAEDNPALSDVIERNIRTMKTIKSTAS